MKKTMLILLAGAVLLCGTALAEETAGYSVAFAENQTTGYVWSFAVSDEAVLAVTDFEYRPAESAGGLVGAGGTHTWLITGKGAGEASVSFYDTWAWVEELTDPQVVYTFSVDESGILTLVSVEGMPEKYMSGMAVVQLQENPTTGYAWQFDAEPEGILTLLSDAYEADDTAVDIAGAGGVHTWIFKGEAAGTVLLTFNYARSFEPDEKPAAVVKLTYIVDDTLTVDLMGLDGDYGLYIN
ncbi:MAG: protease inhibitor I42 family protein [Clostridiales bacterium]|nr:protease inhibitor I42 family protein [Clostridiales bacterium]